MSVRLRHGSDSRSILRGILLVARGRREGLDQFASSPEGLLASLAPLVAFPLVGGALMLAQGQARAALAGFAATLIALLAPAVLSYEPARWWGRERQWLRYATALYWCQWSVPLAGLVLIAIVFPIAALVVPPNAAGIGVIGVLAAYGLWLHWFIARHGLMISNGRAVLLVVLVNAATLLLVLGPQWLATGRLEPALR